MKKVFRLSLIVSICLALGGPLIPLTGFSAQPAASSAGQVFQLPASSPASHTSSSPSARIQQVEAVGLFTYPVVDQPGNSPGFVSNRPGTLTHFQLAQRYGTIGLMAHNTLAGAKFSSLEIGVEIRLQVQGRRPQSYWVTDIRQFQALAPLSPYSDFIDLQNGRRYSASGLFREIYGSGNDLVFQTCLEKNGDPSWGRLFVIASQVPDKYIQLGMLPPFFPRPTAASY
jgi:hypothetical protein